MSLYLWLFILVAICAAFGSNQKWESLAYWFSCLCLTSFLALRYAQGTDWLAYNYIFVSAPTSLNFSSIYYTDAFHSEIGWKLINNLWRCFGFNFSSLSILISFIEMFSLNKFLSKYSPNRAFSLLLSLPIVYFVYFFSALRQGLVIAIFLGFMMPMLENRQQWKFVLTSLLLSMIHSASLALVLVLIFQKIDNKNLYLIIIASAIFGIGFSLVLGSIVSLVGISYKTTGINLLALIYRFVLYLITVMLYSARDDIDDSTKLLFKCYSLGFCIYLIFMSNELISSRLAAPLLAIECALLASLMKNQVRQGPVLLLIIVAICLAMYVKNISSAINQSEYISGINCFNYPYISILNQDEIYRYSTSMYLPYLDIS